MEDTGLVTKKPIIEGQKHPRRNTLVSKLEALKEKNWTKELDMYADFIGAIKDGFYKGPKSILVVDTHQHNDFPADVSVALYDDARLPYCVQYFLEFKLPTIEPRTATHCGQILDYFNIAHEKQPYRSSFVGILSNYSTSWVYVVSFGGNGPKIDEYPCPTLADAIIFAELFTSESHAKIPSLDKALNSKFSYLAIGKHYFLLSVTKQNTQTDNTVRGHTTRQTAKKTFKWFPPRRHRMQLSQFVLKVTHDNHPLDNEITILEKLRAGDCAHIPELVWTRGNEELGIVPIGEPVLPGELAIVSRKIVQGMIKGLKYLHSQGIIHRDIRLSNLILKRKNDDVDVVIIDYETAFDLKGNHSTGEEVRYSGGYICWPR